MKMEWWLQRYSTRVELERSKNCWWFLVRKFFSRTGMFWWWCMHVHCTLNQNASNRQGGKKENEHAARHSVDPQFLQEHDQHLSASSPKLQLASNHRLWTVCVWVHDIHGIWLGTTGEGRATLVQSCCFELPLCSPALHSSLVCFGLLPVTRKR